MRLEVPIHLKQQAPRFQKEQLMMMMMMMEALNYGLY